MFLLIQYHDLHSVPRLSSFIHQEQCSWRQKHLFPYWKHNIDLGDVCLWSYSKEHVSQECLHSIYLKFVGYNSNDNFFGRTICITRRCTFYTFLSQFSIIKWTFRKAFFSFIKQKIIFISFSAFGYFCVWITISQTLIFYLYFYFIITNIVSSNYKSFFKLYRKVITSSFISWNIWISA